RQNVKRRARNRRRLTALKRVTKELERHLAAGEKEKARELLPKLMQAADRAASKGPLHRNKAARIKSKWTRRVSQLDGV
ncbi:MAG: 30S ribosomal protein S20, partial [Candidatus Bipolaricaulia bacterium]